MYVGEIDGKEETTRRREKNLFPSYKSPYNVNPFKFSEQKLCVDVHVQKEEHDTDNKKGSLTIRTEFFEGLICTKNKLHAIKHEPIKLTRTS